MFQMVSLGFLMFALFLFVSVPCFGSSCFFLILCLLFSCCSLSLFFFAWLLVLLVVSCFLLCFLLFFLGSSVVVCLSGFLFVCFLFFCCSVSPFFMLVCFFACLLVWLCVCRSAVVCSLFVLAFFAFVSVLCAIWRFSYSVFSVCSFSLYFCVGSCFASCCSYLSLLFFVHLGDPRPTTHDPRPMSRSSGRPKLRPRHLRSSRPKSPRHSKRPCANQEHDDERWDCLLHQQR